MAPASGRTYEPDRTGPLSGLRILDLSRLVCGNALTMMLADFAADVIKIEDVTGDPLRDWKVEGTSFYWKVYGRNKRSISLDLRTTAGRELLLRLIADADCLVESFRFGVLEKWGLAPDDLLRRNPRLVVVRISGWGQSGPYRARPGYGTLVEAFSGFAQKNGYADKPPLLPNLPLADQVAATMGAFAALVAIRHAERTGVGQVVDVSLLESLHAIIGPDAAVFASTGIMPERTGSRSLTAAPRNIYQCRDGHYIALSAPMQSMAERLLSLIGGVALLTDQRFRTNHDRVQNVDALDAIIGDWIGAKDIEEAMAVFDEAGITAAPICDPDLFCRDAHVIEREILVRLPDDELGELVMQNVTPRLCGSPGGLRRPAPGIGEHTLEILAEFGVDASERDRLLGDGIVKRGGPGTRDR